MEDFDVEKQEKWSPFVLPKAGKLVGMLSHGFSTSTAPKVQSVRHIISERGSLPAPVTASEISLPLEDLIKFPAPRDGNND